MLQIKYILSEFNNAFLVYKVFFENTIMLYIKYSLERIQYNIILLIKYFLKRIH